MCCGFLCLQAEDGIRDLVRSRGLGDVYKRQRIEGQVGRSGIDGLFVKRNADGVVREVLAVESKYLSLIHI